MKESTLSKYLLIDKEDAPSVYAIKETIERLRKDAEILKEWKNAKNNADYKALLEVASFLEALIIKEESRLKKGGPQ